MCNEKVKIFQPDKLCYSWCVLTYNAEIECIYVYAYTVIYTLTV